MKMLLSRLVRRFTRDARGNITSIFALSLIPVMGLVGAAIDYSRANKARTSMQAALDATALAMSSKAATLSAADLQTQASTYFNSIYSSAIAPTVSITATYSTTDGLQLFLSGTATITTKLVNLIGFNHMTISASATARWGMNRLRVAMALDNTGSMAQSGKMTALKAAAKNLIDQLKNAAQVDGDVYVSIVPFARDVNVGSSNYSATWLKWTDWDSQNGSWSGGWGCGGWGGWGCTWQPANHNTWTGCVMDRDQNYDTNNTAPVTGTPATLFPTEQYSDCPVALMPLSYDWTALKNKIDAMSPNGNTNTTIGLEWAWHSLTQGAPLNAPAEDPTYQYTKVIIFLTDGENTQNRWTSTQSAIDARMTLACTNAKNAGISIYTVLVLQGTPAILQSCASNSDQYFFITNANQLNGVFTQIGSKLSKLRIAQ